MTDIGLLLMRLALGGTMVAHGLTKCFGIGGAGMDAFRAELATYHLPFEQIAGLPAADVVAYAVSYGQLVGGALIALGLLSRLAALGLAAIQGGVLWAQHVQPGFPHGFRWQEGGWEFHGVLLAIALGLLLTGPGAISLAPGGRRPKEP